MKLNRSFAFLIVGLMLGYLAHMLIDSQINEQELPSPSVSGTPSPGNNTEQDLLANSVRGRPADPGEGLPVPKEIFSDEKAARPKRGDPGFEEFMREDMKKGAEIRMTMKRAKVSEKLAALTSRLGLDSTQQQSVEAILSKYEDGMIRRSNGARNVVIPSGSTDSSYFPIDTESLTAEISAELSDDQLAEYQVLRDEEILNDSEVKAYNRLASIQSALLLSQPQKDKIFELLVAQGAAELKGETTESTLPAEQLAEILTTEQLTIYGQVEFDKPHIQLLETPREN